MSDSDEDVSDADLDENDELMEEDEDETEGLEQNVRVNHITERTITSEFLTSFEEAAVLFTRVDQIEGGSRVFTDATGLSNPIDIAKKELRERKIPIAIRRQIRGTPIETYCEELPVSKAALPTTISLL